MAQEHETATPGLKYDFFLMARLDAAWLSPLEPLRSYSPTAVHVPDIWLFNVPGREALS